MLLPPNLDPDSTFRLRSSAAARARLDVEGLFSAANASKKGDSEEGGGAATKKGGGEGGGGGDDVV